MACGWPFVIRLLIKHWHFFRNESVLDCNEGCIILVYSCHVRQQNDDILILENVIFCKIRKLTPKIQNDTFFVYIKWFYDWIHWS